MLVQLELIDDLAHAPHSTNRADERAASRFRIAPLSVTTPFEAATSIDRVRLGDEAAEFRADPLDEHVIVHLFVSHEAADLCRGSIRSM